MNLNQLDIIVSDVPQVCAELEHILDIKADYVDDVLLNSRLVTTASCSQKAI